MSGGDDLGRVKRIGFAILCLDKLLTLESSCDAILDLYHFAHLSDDKAVAKMGHPVWWLGKGVGREADSSLGGSR